ncbi:plexin domain-containing protein 2-like isoform X2 [Acanthaster planci]|uniref:Plexin domain-containing protein 2-like isoform X2 n=1 Tax=Acanthaster planci TaxID=133434 RepID=A0A8B7YR77_ACAPL|nr:plexin domain-containing protein 2-like isoform X2 [Acanthaster planci]
MARREPLTVMPLTALWCLLWLVSTLLQQCCANVWTSKSPVYELEGITEEPLDYLVQIHADHHQRHRRELPTQQPETDANVTVIVEDNHRYYTSQCFRSDAGGSAFWVDLDDQRIRPLVEAPETLATGARNGKNVHLNFVFPFYGHEVSSLVITTGGFIYAGSYIHKHLAATQYIAPLMADFSPLESSPVTGVRYFDNGTALTVEWREQNLLGSIRAGIFTFQVTVVKDGRIIFAYKEIPIPVDSISDARHPVKVGIADAYYIDELIAPFTKKREIFEYHSIDIDTSKVSSGTAIVISPLPTCNLKTSCSSCVAGDVAFNCTWCQQLSKCSDGLDRHRQGWLQSGCHEPENYIDDVTKCPEYIPPTEAPSRRPTAPPANVKVKDTTTVQNAVATTKQKAMTGPTGDCEGVECQHGGTCDQGLCKCPSKYQGARCQKYVENHCQGVACKNGGSCVEGLTTHFCDCPVGISGTYCEVVDGPATQSKPSSSAKLTVGAIISIILITLLVLGLFFWAVYAYRHPTSPSGLFILEAKHRIRGRGRGANGVKYKYHQHMEGNQIDFQI